MFIYLFCKSAARTRSENKHFRSCLLVVSQTDLIKHPFNLFINLHHLVINSADFTSFIAIKFHQKSRRNPNIDAHGTLHSSALWETVSLHIAAACARPHPEMRKV